MRKFIRWFAGFFEDGTQNASRKAGALYITLFFLYLIVKRSLEVHVNSVTGKLQTVQIDMNVLALVGLIILFCIGAIAAENVATIWGNKKDKQM